MSGVWVFRNGVARLVSNPLMEPIDGGMEPVVTRRKVLVHVPSNEIISSYSCLEPKLLALGWERYPLEEPDLIQFHKVYSVDLISLPADFSKFKTIHMYDIVVKNKSIFEVRDYFSSS
ncbi:hypothetical protein SELMODRAFT_103635 [Selaginella moellendorffii]|uniref:Flowering-promoting factor 1-like protein 1 n=1 Tax=Selaginella moellendorffii TaxID=88036 RepID=D8RWR5_SELML|nr:flowering-promoting factor 1-like protein 1 [Selaginella moellendorffii]XP_024536456.1 flowering-promoting factor 1-like protein 1 [Selaginella moellendorffii]EFJ05428.1 hypothetical protein SELMODRAFT_137184 [Selaginella moellendorffii]EFJ23135.1 hypothetical protein SELMODRAFT_103635 [Selaginella moellendorffii]|eukprot:XP_024522945.1 flowering-promoting factor 1-like protein 1 [Selaginella moellendorffii]